MNVAATGDTSEFIASEHAAFTGAQRQPYSAAPPFTLSSIPGRKAVFIKVRACAGQESKASSDRISLLGPKVLSFALEGGVATTTSHDVTLSTTFAGNPTEYLASEDRLFTNATWQSLGSLPAFTLSPGTGRKTVYFKVRNDVGESMVRRDTIKVVSQ